MALWIFLSLWIFKLTKACVGH